MRKNKLTALFLPQWLLMRLSQFFCLDDKRRGIGILGLMFLTACQITPSADNLPQIDTPEQITRQYLDNVKKQDWNAVSHLFHEESLKEFKTTLMPIFIDEDAKDFRHSLFGNITNEEVGKLDPQVFFRAFLKNIFSVQLSSRTNNKSLDVIGGVTDGDELYHVLIRTNILTAGKKTPLNDLQIITLKPEKNNKHVWRLVMGDKLKRHAHIIKMKLMSF